MPTYDYRCSECKHTFERILPMKDNDIPKKEPCPECGKEGTVSQYFSSGPKLLHEPSNTISKNVSDGWRDRLKEIKKTTKSNINTIKIP